MSVDTYTIPGTYTWVAPSDGTLAVRVWGAGGYGGDGNGGTGAGGGASALKTITVTAGQSITVVVGAASVISEHDSEDSWAIDVATCFAQAGGAGNGIQPGGGPRIPGYGGNVINCFGDVLYSGGDGGYGGSNIAKVAGGGGGSGAGTGADGGLGGDDDDDGNGGIGGVAPAGGGAGGHGAGVVIGHATNGQAPGGGGGGAANGSADNGGHGADGQAVLTFVPVVVPVPERQDGGGAGYAGGQVGQQYSVNRPSETFMGRQRAEADRERETERQHQFVQQVVVGIV